MERYSKSEPVIVHGVDCAVSQALSTGRVFLWGRDPYVVAGWDTRTAMIDDLLDVVEKMRALK